MSRLTLILSNAPNAPSPHQKPENECYGFIIGRGGVCIQLDKIQGASRRSSHVGEGTQAALNYLNYRKYLFMIIHPSLKFPSPWTLRSYACPPPSPFFFRRPFFCHCGSCNTIVFILNRAQPGGWAVECLKLSAVHPVRCDNTTGTMLQRVFSLHVVFCCIPSFFCWHGHTLTRNPLHWFWIRILYFHFSIHILYCTLHILCPSLYYALPILYLIPPLYRLL